MIRNDGWTSNGLSSGERLYFTRGTSNSFSTASIRSNISSVDYSDAVITQKRRRITSSNNTQYYYLHIPKTGGCSMIETFRKNGIRTRDFGPGFDKPPRDFDQWCQERPDVKIFVSEGAHFNTRQPKPTHSFTMFRDPVSHVVSQFFHCKIADRPGHALMPDTLMEWLQHWNNLQTTKPRLQWSDRARPEARWKDAAFYCYTPLNFQSWLTGFPQTKKDLKRKFDVVGILSDFEKTSCLFLVQVLKLVPLFCDCTNGQPKADREGVVHETHNVSHHGSTYNLTQEERAMIENMTKLDRMLYAQASELFEEQVDYVEKEYGVKLCGKDKHSATAVVD
ncbi:hypothetical protein ACA910_003885 [Epithemia clementina (nom. ined.)]